MREYVDIVDENDTFIRKATRVESDAKRLRRRAVRVIILNSGGEFLIQQRSTIKKIYPGLWDFGIAETVKHAERYEASAVRGLKEELDITVKVRQLKPLLKMPYTASYLERMIMVFKLTYNGKFNRDEDEVADAKFVSKHFMEGMMQKAMFTPPSLAIYERCKSIW